MSALIRVLVIGVVIAVIVTLLCILLGGILAGLKVDIAVTVGGFLRDYGSILGVLAFLWYVATNWPGLPGSAA